MSGTASVSNTFANQSGPIPLSQLDANFTSLVDYANDPTNRNNYAADTGVASTYTVALSPAVAGYTAGLFITFKPGNTNTSSSSINVNNLGAKAIVSGRGNNMASGEIVAGKPLSIVYDGTAFVTPTGFSAADQSAAKAWGRWSATATGTVTALSSFNVSSIYKNGTGDWTVVFTTAFANANYAVMVCAAAANAAIAVTNTQQTHSIRLVCFDNTNSLADPTLMQFVAYGTQ